jgi:N-acyl-D-aspartate/D-glutamate deacylase
LILPQKLGKFFPYYLKAKKPEVFTFLMRQQNADMTSTTIIPIFGYTPEARKQQITIDGEQTTVELALATTSDIIRIKATPSTWNLHKYLVIVANKNKDTVQKAIKQIFRKIEGKLENQPKNFPIPQCGGREWKR